MNRSEKGRNPLRKFVLVAAILYGVSLGWFVVPSVVGSVVPEAARAIRHSASQVSLRNSAYHSVPQCLPLAKTRILVARLWNDFQ